MNGWELVEVVRIITREELDKGQGSEEKRKSRIPKALGTGKLSEKSPNYLRRGQVLQTPNVITLEGKANCSELSLRPGNGVRLSQLALSLQSPFLPLPQECTYYPQTLVCINGSRSDTHTVWLDMEQNDVKGDCRVRDDAVSGRAGKHAARRARAQCGAGSCLCFDHTSSLAVLSQLNSFRYAAARRSSSRARSASSLSAFINYNIDIVLPLRALCSTIMVASVTINDNVLDGTATAIAEPKHVQMNVSTPRLRSRLDLQVHTEVALLSTERSGHLRNKPISNAINVGTSRIDLILNKDNANTYCKKCKMRIIQNHYILTLIYRILGFEVVLSRSVQTMSVVSRNVIWHGAVTLRANYVSRLKKRNLAVGILHAYTAYWIVSRNVIWQSAYYTPTPLTGSSQETLRGSWLTVVITNRDSHAQSWGNPATAIFPPWVYSVTPWSHDYAPLCDYFWVLYASLTDMAKMIPAHIPYTCVYGICVCGRKLPVPSRTHSLFANTIHVPTHTGVGTTKRNVTVGRVHVSTANWGWNYSGVVALRVNYTT
ncbi:hypothetical protein J6590_032586 [Homalodisca vitripennis]|nr:hypothetical protein J6590_032586 [Homalodisca vitripennis]